MTRDLAPNYLGALTLLLMIGIVLARIYMLRQYGVAAMKFGQIDKTDFLTPRLLSFIFTSYSLPPPIGLRSAARHFFTWKPWHGSGCSSVYRDCHCCFGVSSLSDEAFGWASIPTVLTG